MKFVPYNRKDLNKGYKPGRNQALLFEFAESGLDCARVADFPHKSAKNFQTCLIECAKRIGLSNTIQICVRSGQVYLLRRIDDRK